MLDCGKSTYTDVLQTLEALRKNNCTMFQIYRVSKSNTLLLCIGNLSNWFLFHDKILLAYNKESEFNHILINY